MWSVVFVGKGWVFGGSGVMGVIGRRVLCYIYIRVNFVVRVVLLWLKNMEKYEWGCVFESIRYLDFGYWELVIRLFGEMVFYEM